MNHSAYFDHNATTPLLPQVISAIGERLQAFGNPSSYHTIGRYAKTAVEADRESVAQLIGARAENLFFTAGGTESNNLAIRGLLQYDRDEPGHIITSAIEHPSVLDVVKHVAAQHNWDVSLLPVNALGQVSPDDLKRLIRPATRLISVMLVNNEIGSIQPVAEIAQIARSANIPLHIDAVQGAGKVNIDVEALGVDTMSLSSHKLHGPKGIGALYIRNPGQFSPAFQGGGQERSIRSGTENTVGIAGFATAARLATQEIELRQRLFSTAKSRLVTMLGRQLDGVFINGSLDNNVCTPNTLNIGFESVRGEALAAILDTKYGISVSLGSACSSNKQAKLSHVLLALGLSESQIRRSIRISFGATTVMEDVDYLGMALIDSVSRLRSVAQGAEVPAAFQRGFTSTAEHRQDARVTA